jgi:hypothetical protein
VEVIKVGLVRLGLRKFKLPQNEAVEFGRREAWRHPEEIPIKVEAE